MNFFALLLAVVTFFSTLLGGSLASRYQKNIGLLAAFSAGVLIAVTLFDLLPETFKLAVSVNISLDNVMYLTAIGFIFLYFINYYSPHRPHSDEIHKHIRHPIGGLFATTELTAHSFLDGLIIGVGFQLDIQVGIIVSVAIICHDFSDGLSTVTVMLNSGNSLKNSLRMLFLDAITPLLGVIATFFIQIPQYSITLLIPFFAGGFLYLGASDLLPQSHEKTSPLKVIAINITGFIFIYILSIIINI